MSSKATVFKRVADTTPRSTKQINHERYRRRHAPVETNTAGIRLGTVKAFIYDRLLSGGTASGIAQDVLAGFGTENMTQDKMRFRVMQYVSEFRTKYRMRVSTSGWGDNLVYKMEAP